MMQAPRILVVGAGGIGCELLKTLVLSKFTDLTVVDMDTIDMTNLNRQFLFRREDVGRPKAEVAAEIITRLRPEVTIKGLKTSITSLKSDFFSQFDVVLNALDNLEARRYVNRMCHCTQVPLIDAGTNSKKGQVSVHIPGKTKCYECEPKETPKQYPVCTIRSSPNKPEHCIAWSKYLYEALFGPDDPSNMLSDLQIHTSTQAREIFDKLFASGLPDEAKPLVYNEGFSNEVYAELSQISLTSIFIESYSKLKDMEKKPFDKNDKLIVKFVFSASNLRALNFNLALTEKMKVQQIAGNIVPAVGSTNAIVSGLQVIQAVKLIANSSVHGTVWLHPEPSNNKYIVPESSEPPHKNCFICSSGKCYVTLDFAKTLFKDFVLSVLIKQLNFSEPTIIKNSEVLYEAGDSLEDDVSDIYAKNLNQTLLGLNFKNGDELICDDNIQMCKFILVLSDQDVPLPQVSTIGSDRSLKRSKSPDELFSNE